MAETYPDDATLLALTEDSQTGVPYIETGASPYYLPFRRMLYRLLRASERANDLRVYADGELSLGVRPGRATIGDRAVPFAGAGGLALEPGVTRRVYLGADGKAQVASTPPGERATCLLLAEVTTGAGGITELRDLRGEAMLQSLGPGALGLTATAGEVNRALEGATDRVTAAALSVLCGGPDVGADNQHRHGYFSYADAGPRGLTLSNSSDGPGANVGLTLSLGGRFAEDAVLERDPASGFLRQRRGEAAYVMRGAAAAATTFPGAVTGSVTGRLVGPAPVAGTVEAVVLSVGANLQSSAPGDKLTATVKAGQVAVAAADPSISAAAGSGFRCTDRGDGTAGVLKTNAEADVKRGDLLSVDLTRAASGTVSAEARDAAVTVVIRAAAPA